MSQSLSINKANLKVAYRKNSKRSNRILVRLKVNKCRSKNPKKLVEMTLVGAVVGKNSNIAMEKSLTDERTYDTLIAELVKTGLLENTALYDAFASTDRRDFVPEEQKGLAYLNQPVPIGCGQTISQPA